MTVDARAWRTAGAFLFLVILCACAFGSDVQAALPEPPPVVLRDIAGAPRVARGTSITLEQTTVTVALAGKPPKDVSTEVVLFLPDGWKDTVTPEGIRLTVHFHGAPWYIREEHTRRGARHPLLSFHLGEGSSMYQKPLENRAYFPGLLEKARGIVAEQAGVPGLRFQPLEVQSFSAGYGAVRELLKENSWQREIRRLVLADSLYASLVAGPDGRQQPDPNHMLPFVRYAEQARQPGRQYQFLFAHSTIRVDSYADTARTGGYIIEQMGGTRIPVAPGSLAAALPGAPFALQSRYDANGLHVWEYNGSNPQAHMAIARTIPEFWNALDAALKD